MEYGNMPRLASIEIWMVYRIQHAIICRLSKFGEGQLCYPGHPITGIICYRPLN